MFFNLTLQKLTNLDVFSKSEPENRMCAVYWDHIKYFSSTIFYLEKKKGGGWGIERKKLVLFKGFWMLT